MSGAPRLLCRVVTDAGPGPVRTIELAPELNRGFSEGRTVQFAIAEAAELEFRVDDEPLTIDPAAPGWWAWTPAYFAGTVTAELCQSTGEPVATFLLDVSPHQDKLGGDMFAAMIAELWSEDPALVLGGEPVTESIGGEGRLVAPLIEYARLRRHGRALVEAFRSAGQLPLHELRASREVVPLHRVRRIDRVSALAAARRPDVAAVLQGEDAVPGLLLDVPHNEAHLDGAANRCMAALLGAVTHRVRGVRMRLREMASAEKMSETRSPLATRWPAREAFLARLQRALVDLRRGEPWSEVTRPEITAAGLSAVTAHPTYARAARLARRILRPGVDGPPTDDRAWISPTWEIYERWCFVRLARELRNSRTDLSWKPLRGMHGSRAAWIATGAAETIQLLLQPTFGAGDATNLALRSLSGQREPDIVLLVEGPTKRRLIILDAKYRAGRSNVLDAMTSAHVYHDSLRWNGERPELAVLLVPRGGGAPWLENPDFQRTHGVGAIEYGGDGGAVLAEALAPCWTR